MYAPAGGAVHRPGEAGQVGAYFFRYLTGQGVETRIEGQFAEPTSRKTFFGTVYPHMAFSTGDRYPADRGPKADFPVGSAS